MAAKAYLYFEDKEIDEDIPEVYFDVADSFIDNKELNKAWESGKHPRGKDGRFISTMSESDKSYLSNSKEHQAWKNNHYSGAADKISGFLSKSGVSEDEYKGDIEKIKSSSDNASEYKNTITDLSKKVKGKVDKDEFRKLKANIRIAEYKQAKKSLSEKPKEEAKDDSKETEKQKIDKQKAIEHPYDSNKKNARMLINQDNSISVQGDYNPDFIDYAHKNKAKWNSDDKTWTFPTDKTEQLKKDFYNHYNNLAHQHVKDAIANNKVEKEKALQEKQKQYEEKADKEDATPKQLDYIDKLLTRYVSASGEELSHASFGKITKLRASALIDGLKGGEEQVSYMGLFKR